jgi:hypothetical protein
MQTAAELVGRQGAEQLLRVVPRPNPAAGVEVDIVVPGGVIWLVQSLRVGFVTNAVVATRVVHLTVDDGTTEFCRIIPAAWQDATFSCTYTWCRDYGVSSGTMGIGGTTLPFPTFPLLSGFHIRTATINLQAGDDFGAPMLYVQEIQERGLAAEIAYEVAALVREDLQLSAIETGGF